MSLLARDGREIIQGTFGGTALEETYDSSISGSTEITLNAATTIIEVTSFAKGLFLKWGTSDAASTDWDHCVAQDTTRLFIVPVDTSTGARYTAFNVIEQAASAAVAVSEF